MSQIDQLLNLARGIAICDARNGMTSHDLRVLRLRAQIAIDKFNEEKKEEKMNTESRDFDLAAAKCGDPVECSLVVGKWESVHFVGLDINGNPVVQRPRDYAVSVGFESLRMGPKPPRVMWVQVYMVSGERLCSNPRATAHEAISICGRYMLIGEPQQILVPEE